MTAVKKRNAGELTPLWPSGDLTTDIERTARRLLDLFEAKYGLDGLDAIVVDHNWVGGRWCDGSEGPLIQYRGRRVGERP